MRHPDRFSLPPHQVLACVALVASVLAGAAAADVSVDPVTGHARVDVRDAQLGAVLDDLCAAWGLALPRRPAPDTRVTVAVEGAPATVFRRVLSGRDYVLDFGDGAARPGRLFLIEGARTDASAADAVVEADRAEPSDVPTVAELETVLKDGDADFATKRAAVSALTARGDRGAIGALTRAAKAESDPSLQGLMITALELFGGEDREGALQDVARASALSGEAGLGVLDALAGLDSRTARRRLEEIAEDQSADPASRALARARLEAASP